MSLKIGGSKSKTSSTSNSTSNSTTTPIVPEWASTLTQGVAGRVGEVNRLDPYGLVAPTNGLQDRAAAGAENLSGSPWNFDGAADLARGVARQGPQTYAPTTGQSTGYDAAAYGGAHLGPATQAQSASVLDNLSAYYNPFRNQITDPVLADFDVNAGRTRAQQDLDLAGSGAFGGSGAALTRSMTEGELSRARASTLGGLLGDMFKTSTGLASGDADRRQQVSLANADAADRFAIAQSGYDQQTGQANAEALNRAREFGANAQNSFAQVNMNALNDAGRYNADANDRTLQRQLDAARGLTDISSAYDANQRGNIATQASMGAMQRDIDQQQRQAPITHAQQVVAMLNGLPINLFTGQQTQGTQSNASTGKTKNSSFDLSVSPQDVAAWMAL